MGKTLAQYAEENPQEMPEAEREQMQRTATMREQARERRQDQAHIERLKQSILTQLEQGNAPQYILYTALEAIGTATQDDEFTEAGKKCLDNVYADLAQQSLLTDNAAIAAARIKEMHDNYNDRLRRQLEKQLTGYQKIAKGLNEALAALDDLEDLES